MRRRTTSIVVLVAVGLALGGCGVSQDPAQRSALAALSLKTPQAAPSKTTPTVKSCGQVTASLRPPAVMPTPGAMPSGSYMAQIKRRGYLIAGVNASFLDFGYLNPFTGRIVGFEIDLVRQVARAIFGNPDAFQLKALTANQRIPFVNQGNVDIVVDAVTITCTRKREVDFSTVYYDAKQRVLVQVGSPIKDAQNLAGKRVCATEHTTPLDVIARLQPLAIRVGKPQAIDCLVALQQNKIDAISTDDSILRGFTAQDPNTRILPGPPLADVPYGMAISKAHPEFVRFVNGVLAQIRADGTWRGIASRWLGKFGPVSAPPRPIYSG